MGSAPKESAGAAGALESTGYELGGGLGVTLFGVLVNSIYRSSFSGPAGTPDGAMHSIGEAMAAARNLGGDMGGAIAGAAKTAFLQAHGSVLILVAAMIAILALVVFIALRGAPTGQH
jgi:DHA2 family multidrug resistance protein-like MFS transporter